MQNYHYYRRSKEVEKEQHRTHEVKTELEVKWLQQMKTEIMNLLEETIETESNDPAEENQLFYF